MRTFSASHPLNASPAQAWALLSDVCRWPQWLPTVRRVEQLAGTTLAPGARYKIWQPQLAPAVWVVTEVQPGRSFSWESRSPGVKVLAEHVLSGTAPEGPSVLLRISFSGLLSGLVARLYGGLTQQYLVREAQALNAALRAAGRPGTG